MKISFRQGILRHPYSGLVQQFLQASGGSVNLLATNGPTEITFAYKTANYTYTEELSVPAAWGPFSVVQDYWLFWDIDLRTGARTFGYTTLEPIVSALEPTLPTEGQHWFDTTTTVMKVRNGSSWREVVRVFAARFDTINFYPVAGGTLNMAFAGTQVGLIANTVSGTLLFDDQGKPLRKTNGEFITSENPIFINGGKINVVTLEQSVVTLTALEPIPAFNVVKLSGFGQIEIAAYEDVGTTILYMVLEVVPEFGTTNPITQGVVTNSAWTWTTPGALLWVDNGALVAADPYITNITLHPAPRVPVARVITPTSVFFEQGLGGTGAQGPVGPSGTAINASAIVKGVSRLSTTPVSSTEPISVGDNDPRMTDARNPLTHNQAATTITVTPYGGVTGPSAQLAFQQVEDNKLNKSGGTMTGLLTLSGNPVSSSQAATKQYVDSLVSGLVWIDPIVHINLISDNISTPPATPLYSEVYIVKAPGTGVWTGLDNHVVVWNGTTWNDTGLLSAYGLNTRVGISFESPTASGGTFVGKENQIATLTNLSPVTWNFTTPVHHNAVYVNGGSSLHAYHQYAYDAVAVSWVEFGGASPPSSFLDLTDTPANYVGGANKVVAVKSSQDGLEFVTLISDHGTLTGLGDDDHPQYLKIGTGAGTQTMQDNLLGVRYTQQMAQPGEAILITGTARWYPPNNMQIIQIRATVGVVSVGAAINVVIKVNGTSITASPIVIAAGANSSGFIIPTNIGPFSTIDFFTVDVTQIGSTTPGSDLMVQIIYKTTS